MAGDAEHIRKTFRDFGRDLARDSVRFWLDYFGVKPRSGGRPRHKEFTINSKAWPVGDAVERAIERYQPLFALKARLRLTELRRELQKRGITADDVDRILASRTPKAAAIRAVSSRSPYKPKTVMNYYLQYQRKRPRNRNQ